MVNILQLTTNFLNFQIASCIDEGNKKKSKGKGKGKNKSKDNLTDSQNITQESQTVNNGSVQEPTTSPETSTPLRQEDRFTFHDFAKNPLKRTLSQTDMENLKPIEFKRLPNGALDKENILNSFKPVVDELKEKQTENKTDNKTKESSNTSEKSEAVNSAAASEKESSSGDSENVDPPSLLSDDSLHSESPISELLKLPNQSTSNNSETSNKSVEGSSEKRLVRQHSVRKNSSESSEININSGNKPPKKKTSDAATQTDPKDFINVDGSNEAGPEKSTGKSSEVNKSTSDTVKSPTPTNVSVQTPSSGVKPISGSEVNSEASKSPKVSTNTGMVEKKESVVSESKGEASKTNEVTSEKTEKKSLESAIPNPVISSENSGSKETNPSNDPPKKPDDSKIPEKKSEETKIPEKKSEAEKKSETEKETPENKQNPETPEETGGGSPPGGNPPEKPKEEKLKTKNIIFISAIIGLILFLILGVVILFYKN